MNTPGFAHSDYDAPSMSYRNQVTSDTANPNPRYRVAGIVGNLDEWLSNSFIGPDNYVRGKFYVYTGGQVDPAASNQVPGMRVRIANRFSVCTQLEVFSSVGVDPTNEPTYAELIPSRDPAKPSVYRLDFDPVEVPYIMSNNTEGVLRGFEAYALEPQMNGYIALTESVIGVYPLSLASNGAAPLKIYQTSGVDAGDLQLFSPVLSRRPRPG